MTVAGMSLTKLEFLCFRAGLLYSDVMRKFRQKQFVFVPLRRWPVSLAWPFWRWLLSTTTWWLFLISFMNWFFGLLRLRLLLLLLSHR